MSEKISIQDKIQFNAIQDLCASLDLETDPVLAELRQSLHSHLQRIRGPITLQTEILLATKEISQNEVARGMLNEILTPYDWLHGVKGFFNPIPGGGSAIPPGPSLYCPVKGCNYRQFQVQKGVQLTCKYHPDTLLVNKPSEGKGG